MIAKVKTNTSYKSNYRKLATSVRAKEACKNHDACRARNCQHKKLQPTNLDPRRDDWLELLFCTRIPNSTTIPGDLNDGIDRPRLSVRQVHISIPRY